MPRFFPRSDCLPKACPGERGTDSARGLDSKRPPTRLRQLACDLHHSCLSRLVSAMLVGADALILPGAMFELEIQTSAFGAARTCQRTSQE